MNMPVSTEAAQDFTDMRSIPHLHDPSRRAILTGLLGVAERVMELTTYLMSGTAANDSAPDSESAQPSEPTLPGLYRDRDGDIWQKTETGWRLCVQQGVAIDTNSMWNWLDGHVRDYGPFISLAAN